VFGGRNLSAMFRVLHDFSKLDKVKCNRKELKTDFIIKKESEFKDLF
jgi:hypothetical protein